LLSKKEKLRFSFFCIGKEIFRNFLSERTKNRNRKRGAFKQKLWNGRLGESQFTPKPGYFPQIEILWGKDREG